MPVLLQKELRLNLNRIPYNRRDRVMEDVKDYLFKETIRYVRKGFSPVSGHGQFKKLDPNYAKEEKGGNRTPNLSLEGDMFDEYDINHVGNIIRVGYFMGKESDQADGHNQLTEKAKKWASKSGMPLRRWIPSPDETYSKGIMDGIERILEKSRDNDYLKLEEAKIDQRQFRDVNDRRKNESVAVSELFDDERIAALLFNEWDN